jgi:hypothetical protein
VRTLSYREVVSAQYYDRSRCTRPADDAVSLHTLAEQDDYATQEQEDADFALALSLEEEEDRHARSFAETNTQSRERGARTAQGQQEEQARQRIGPYRDNPYDEDIHEDYIDDTPYRDDAEAIVVETEEDAETSENGGQKRRCVARCLGWIRHLAKKPPSLLRKHSLWAVITALMFIAVLFSVILFVGLRGHDGAADQQPTTRKQQAFKKSGSVDGNISLPNLYPKLEDGASAECKDAWEKLGHLRCPEAVLWTAWDKGDGDTIRESKMDIYAWSRLACDSAGTGCERAIGRLNEDLVKICTKRTDRFDILEYRKRELQYFKEEELDDGPIQVMQSFGTRWNRLCDQPYGEIWGTPIEWGTWPAELWMRWGSADGKDSATDMRYLDTFFEATSEKKTIEAHVERGFIETDRGIVEYKVNVPARKIGPGDGETDCDYSMLSWLERKWASFEYGLILDPQTDEPLGLAAFNELMEKAVKRCKKKIPGWIKRARHTMWEQYGWWCAGKLCREDEPVPHIVLELLNGLTTSDLPIQNIRMVLNTTSVAEDTVEALQALHDSLLSMPCSIWHAMKDLEDIGPSDYRIRRICSNECRTSVDRIQRQHGELFAKVSHVGAAGGIFFDWEFVRMLANITCTGPKYDELITNLTPFCAPGYAFLDRLEWILPFPETIPTNKDILDAFAPAVDTLAKSLPVWIYKPSPDVETQRRLARQISESVCNRCAIELLIGSETNRRERVSEFLSDEEVNKTEYRRVVRLLDKTCAKVMLGTRLAKEKEHDWDWIE